MIYTVTFNPAIDYVVRLDAPLEVGAVNRAQGEDCVLGGKGINVSGVLAQLGCESVALGFVAGETGAWLERGLAAQGLKTDFVHLENGMTRINVKIKAGQETELNGAGPAIPESALQQLEAQLDKLTEGDILILAGSIPASLPQSVYERLLARLQGRGVRAVVDATRDLLVNVLPYHPFLIKPNNHELGEIVGKVLTSDAEIVAAARTLQEKGARNVLVSMAGDGALLLDEQGQVHTQIITYLFCSATNSNLIITDRRYSENLIEPIGPFSERSRIIINKTAIWINIQVSFILQHSIFRSRTHLKLTAILELKSFTGSNVHLCFTFSTLLGGNNDYTVSTARTIHGSSRSILQYLHGLNIMVTQE